MQLQQRVEGIQVTFYHTEDDIVGYANTETHEVKDLWGQVVAQTQGPAEYEDAVLRCAEIADQLEDLTPAQAMARRYEDPFNVGRLVCIIEDGSPWLMDGESIVASITGDYGDPITEETKWQALSAG